MLFDDYVLGNNLIFARIWVSKKTLNQAFTYITIN